MGHTEGQMRRPRDADETRRLLLAAAQARFANEGYAATTVRAIADDAGVNVALINRYFGSKEGLFEACLADAGHALAESTAEVTGFDQLTRTVSRAVFGPGDASGLSPALRLLLRSSGDERAERIRAATLRGYGERLAALAGWSAGEPDAGDLLLRAQLVLATAIGIVLLRSQPTLEPLSLASPEELQGPLSDLVHAVLGGTACPE